LHRFCAPKLRDRTVDHQLPIVIRTERPNHLDMHLTMNGRCLPGPCPQNHRLSLVITSL
jgi:hypothetical protein